MENNYVTKEDFNKFKEGIKPIFMDLIKRIETLEGKIDLVLEKTNQVYNIVNSRGEVKAEQKTEVNTSELIKYNRDSVKELFNASDDDFTKKFTQSILSKDYDTLTQKQFNKLLELANKANYYKPIKKDE